MESDCTLRLGLSSLIKSISNTRQSNLLLHFFKMLKLLLRSLGAEECLRRKCWPMDELALLCSALFAGVSGEMCNQHNLHRTGHIHICKQGIAG